ncbi:hypothetical protein R3P38DRAFT_3416225 [Favolaschia claudopus]|uniref:Transposase n=1 Tax=Favolaschia claudopus TaxID=2862362 RepID=A0AAW0AIP2_9AGAR
MQSTANLTPPSLVVWDFSADPNGKAARCLICRDGVSHQTDYNRRRHEQTSTHRIHLDDALETQRATQPAFTNPPTESKVSEDALRHLLASLSGPGVRPYPESAYQHPESPPGVGINWNLMEINNEGELAMSADEQAVALIAGNILERFDLPVSDEEPEERSDSETESLREPEVNEVPKSAESEHSTRFGPPPTKRARMQDETGSDRYWFPWPDRISCTLDILMHLPRSVFSQKQLDLFLWLLKVNEVDDVPSIKQMQKINLALQKVCGIETLAYDGALGHKYFVNSLAQIIAQEMANPRVRPHLHFYPEDSGEKLSEARQGERWLHELPDEQTTPMVRISAQDYYIYEPAMLDSAEGEFCVPIRWFSRGGEFFAKCWRMVAISTDTVSGWRIIQTDDYEVSARRFLKNFLQFQTDAGLHNVPHPSKILDVYNPDTHQSRSWDHTNPSEGNRWRAKANGSRVVVFPMWVYCDDTSGNVSKKWNEHNSFLMTPAGLPRAEAQKEYNIHFLCTSNIAQPLEMLDGIVEQLEQAQGDGIWVWDIEHNEPVLVIPEVLALLGDNPMQSEFACHIGLRGKLFCRACWVKGHDAMDGDDGDDAPAPSRHQRAPSDAESVQSDGASVAGSDVSSEPESDKAAPRGAEKRKPAKRFQETMSDMVQRVKSFMKVGKLRRKPETTDKLRSFFTEASTKLDTKTKIKSLRTETGLKDTFQLVFIEKLFASYHKKRGAQTKQAALDAAVAALPKETTSPVWRIRGLDPHQDTPVEILHVILLGFVKYLWRDVIAQLKGKDEKKELLIARLTSVDVTGLGISPLAGRTLVQYSGSLTGRDFRAIAQVAPFVLYDLVSSECLETWQALSKLVPLIWQPEIEDIGSYVTLVTKEIDHFLLCAAKWTTRWFNKPKFHIILHLPAHIRRFGPAILFATEAFESFNAIIRAKSVHSNRHAPSRDIAHAFAQGNRIRHLLSGGLFVLKEAEFVEDSSTGRNTPRFAFTRERTAWRSIGEGPRRLVQGRSTVTAYLGLDQKKSSVPGNSTADQLKPRLMSHTITGQRVQSWSAKPGLYQTNKSLVIENGDTCAPGNFVVAHDWRRSGDTFVGRVEEILHRVDPQATQESELNVVLLRRAVVNTTRERYGMPSVVLSEEWAALHGKDVLCTVNVQHNCKDNLCATTASVPVFQERVKTSQTAARVSHTKNVDDVVLNTAQMRDAVYVQRYRVNSVPMDVDRIVTESAAKEIDARKKRTGTVPAARVPARPRSDLNARIHQAPSALRAPSVSLASSSTSVTTGGDPAPAGHLLSSSTGGARVPPSFLPAPPRPPRRTSARPAPRALPPTSSVLPSFAGTHFPHDLSRAQLLPPPASAPPSFSPPAIQSLQRYPSESSATSHAPTHMHAPPHHFMPRFPPLEPSAPAYPHPPNPSSSSAATTDTPQVSSYPPFDQQLYRPWPWYSQ